MSFENSDFAFAKRFGASQTLHVAMQFRLYHLPKQHRIDELRGVLRVVVEEPLNCLQSLTLPRMTQRIFREKHRTNILKYFGMIDFVMEYAIFSVSHVSVLQKFLHQLDDLSIFHSCCEIRL